MKEYCEIVHSIIMKCMTSEYTPEKYRYICEIVTKIIWKDIII